MFRQFLEKSMVKQTQDSGKAEEQYCLIRWSDKLGFDIVPLQQVKAPSTSVAVYETYTVDFHGKQRKGTVILRGGKQECEKLQYNMIPSSPTTASYASNIRADAKGDDDHDETTIRNTVLMKLLQMIMSGTTSGNEDNGEEHKVHCGACGTNPIRSDRYKCLNCDDFNLCAQCFERRRESKHHKSGHAFVHFKLPGELFGRSVTDDDLTFNKLKQVYGDDVHESVSCDGCKREGIKGLRFKCDTCPNYDLCQQCVQTNATSKEHKSTHPLIVIPRRPIQQIAVEDIELGEELGSGAFGSVHKARWISKKRLVACKVITVPNSSEAERLEKSFLKEIAAYAELSGAYILKTYGFAAARYGKGKQYMIIMEYMSRGSLAHLIEKKGDKICFQQKLDMAMNIASGIRKIHEHQMIHRDIRPDNILVNDKYVAKIGDMGIARVVDPMNQHTQIGYQPYMPPEFYRGDYNQKLDIFTFGLTLNELFTSTRHSFQPSVSNKKIAFQKQSPIFDNLIARCTADDPKRRPTATEIEKTFDLYITGFNEIVLKKHPSYATASTEDKDKIFIAFYEEFSPPAIEFIRKKFPPEFLDGPEDIPGVKVDKSASEGVHIECPVQ